MPETRTQWLTVYRMSLQDKLRASQQRQMGVIDVNIWDKVLAQILKLTSEFDTHHRDAKYIAINILWQLSTSPRKQLITELSDVHAAIASLIIAAKYLSPNTWRQLSNALIDGVTE